MNTLIVNKITMHGFKNHEDLVEFDLGEYTKVLGANGKGKTTIGEAIAWGLIGSDLTGNERATTRLVNEKCKDVYVELNISFNNENHTIIRRRKGSTISIYLDDKKVTQNELISFYNNKELFLSIFSPTYFPSLAPKDAKLVLDGVLEEVSKEDVYSKLPESVVETLKQTGFGNLNLYLENQRDRLKEINQEIQYWNGFKEGKDEVIEVLEAMKFDEKPLQELKDQLAEVNNLKIAKLHDIDELLTKREILRNGIREIKLQIDTILVSKAQITDTGKLQIQVSSLRTRYTDKQMLIKGLDNVVNCPKCETVIDLDEDTKSKAREELEQLKVEGLAAANKLSDIEKSNTEIELTHKSHVTESVNDLKLELSKLETEVEALNISKYQQENADSEKEQQAVITEQRNLIQTQINEQEQLKQQVAFNNSQREEAIKRKEAMESKIKDAADNMIELKTEETKVKTCIDYAKQFASKRLEIQAEEIDKHLDKVTIKLEKITADGEVKPDFKILYDGKEFAILSNSERIKAGLEVANLLMNASGLFAPVFVDNAESITEIPKIDTQMIEARVKADAELTVEVAQ